MVGRKKQKIKNDNGPGIAQVIQLHNNSLSFILLIIKQKKS